MKNYNSFLTHIPRNKKTYFICGILIVLLIARMALPLLIKRYFNDYLATGIENYIGHIKDVDVAVWRGAYTIKKFELRKRTSKKNIPFIVIEKTEISISWKALLSGKFSVDLKLLGPKINFIDSTSKADTQLGGGVNWETVLNNIVPFYLENLKITNGEINFKNSDDNLPGSLSLKNIEGKALNIHNSKKLDSELFSEYEVTAIAQSHASLNSKGSFTVMVEPPSFDINLKLENLKLSELNRFIKVYAPINITSGEFNFYLELASKRGVLKGYMKPIFTKMIVSSARNEENDSFRGAAYKILTTVINAILKNRYTKSSAAKIPIEGNLKNPELNIWKGVKSAFGNSFSKYGIKPEVDKEINIKSLKSK